MSDNNRTAQPATIFVRDDLTLLVTAGDRTIEIQLSPQAAFETASALLSVGLECAQRNALARTGSLAVIEAARTKEPNDASPPQSAH